MLVGVRDRDVDYGPFKRLELVQAERGRQPKKLLTLPASEEGVRGPEVLADFSPSGVLWFANQTATGGVRLDRVEGAEVTEREVQLGDGKDAGELSLFSLRALGEAEVWLVGQREGVGVLFKLPAPYGAPKVFEVPTEFPLKDVTPLSKDEVVVVGVRSGNTKDFAITTHLSRADASLKKPTAKAAPVAGWPLDIAPVGTNLVAALTSAPVPGRLSLHLFTDALALVRSVTLAEGGGFTGRASLLAYKGSAVVFISNHGKCSLAVVDPATGRIVRSESMDTGQNRCVDIRAAESGGQVVLATTLWRLQGNGFRVGVQANVRSLDDIVAGAR
jgi:hypothetical protein